MDRNKRITKPKYEIIKEALLERIRTGQFSSDAVFCTEKMLSEQYEVSRITAKRAIEDLEQQGILYRKRGVGSFVSQKIPPVSSSASETDSKSKMVSLLLPFATTQGNISETIGSLSAALAEKGYFLSIHITGSSSPKERATLELLRSQNIAGLVYYPKRDNIHLEQLNDFLFANRPVVIIDKQTDCPYLNNVVCDNYDGGRQLTRHLLEQGHRNIAFFTTAPLSETSSVRDRFGGFLHEIKAAGIMPDSRQLITWPHTSDLFFAVDSAAFARSFRDRRSCRPPFDRACVPRCPLRTAYTMRRHPRSRPCCNRPSVGRTGRHDTYRNQCRPDAPA